MGRYIAELKNVIPGLRDSIGKPLAFENHEFQLLDSDISNKNVHKIAIIYTSDWFDLLAIAGNYLIVGNSRRMEVSQPLQFSFGKISPLLNGIR